MKLIALSDTHMRHSSIKAFQDYDWVLDEPKEPLSGDAVIHAGDALNRGTYEELVSFMLWYSKLNFKHRIYVPGNHDKICEINEPFVKIVCQDNNIIYLNDSGVTLEGIKFWGMAANPYFNNWSFNRARNQAEADQYKIRFMKDHTDQIPDDIDVLITHSPAYEILDGTQGGTYVGCQDIKDAIKRVKPDIHISGHIHYSRGEMHVDGTSHYNASICDETYYPAHQPFVIEYNKE